MHLLALLKTSSFPMGWILSQCILISLHHVTPFKYNFICQLYINRAWGKKNNFFKKPGITTLPTQKVLCSLSHTFTGPVTPSTKLFLSTTNDIHNSNPVRLQWSWKIPITWWHHSWHNIIVQHVIRVCGDAGADKPTALPVVQKYSTNNYAQYLGLDNDTEWLLWVYAFTTLYLLFLSAPFLCVKKKFAVKQYAKYAEAFEASKQPQISHDYPCLLTASFSLALDLLSGCFMNFV